LESLKTSREFKPENPNVHSLIGFILEMNNQYTEGLKAYRTGLEMEQELLINKYSEEDTIFDCVS